MASYRSRGNLSDVSDPPRHGFDRKRKKKTSNKDWTSPSNPDAQMAKMKDGGSRQDADRQVRRITEDDEPNDISGLR